MPIYSVGLKGKNSRTKVITLYAFCGVGFALLHVVFEYFRLAPSHRELLPGMFLEGAIVGLVFACLMMAFTFRKLR